MSAELRSENRRFGIALSDPILDKVSQMCSHHFPQETGGIMIGVYDSERAVATVTEITPPPLDSRAGKTWFHRGLAGLAGQLKARWARPREERTYYLGEWHLHPGGEPIPSHTDRTQMQTIADAEACHCPEPLLLLVGGNLRTGWILGAYVFRRGGVPLPLSVVAGCIQLTAQR